MEYCGFRTSQVKASSRGGRSRKGNEQKPKKAHSRRSCYKTADAGLNDAVNCRISDNNRCVVMAKNNAKADARRSRSRSRSAARRAARRQAGGRPEEEERPQIGHDGSFCASLSQEDCEKAASSKKFPCQWNAGTGKKKPHCARKSRSKYTQGE